MQVPYDVGNVGMSGPPLGVGGVLLVDPGLLGELCDDSFGRSCLTRGGNQVGEGGRGPGAGLRVVEV